MFYIIFMFPVLKCEYMSAPVRVLEVVQSLGKGGRTTRFMDTVLGLKQQGIYTVSLCLSKPVSWIHIPNLQVIYKNERIDWRLIFRIRKIIKNHNINLIHAHCELSQLYASIAGFTCGVKTVATFHRSDLSKYQPNPVNKLIKLFSSYFIAVSYSRLSLLTVNLQLPESKCDVIHGGTYISSKPTVKSINEARDNLSIDCNEIAFLSIGHLGEIKGHQYTIRALVLIIKNNPNVHLYIAGDGLSSEKKALIDLVMQLNIEKYVSFLGQIDNTAMWIEACDIFIQPSIEEAFGLVFVEAGAKAKPVVATTVGGITEIVISEETGILVPPASPAQLATAMTTLINSETLRKKYGNNGFNRVTKNFSLLRMINRYLVIFQQVKDT